MQLGSGARPRENIVSEQDLGKKLVEEMELEPFLDEYESITGIALLEVRRSERPDFLCMRNGEPVGLELVRAMRDPISRHWLAGPSQDGQMSGLDAAILVQEAVYAKERKRVSLGWQYPDQTILVVQLMDAEVGAVTRHLDEELMDEMSSTGFVEIWVADYTVLDPHSTVQLLGVKPLCWRGPHPHRFYGMKPYG